MLVSHRSATKPPWEACWQANIPTPKGRNSPASWAPTDPPRSRCGKLAGKRIPQHQRAGIRQQAGLPRIRHEAAVGSLLASEYPNTRGPEFASMLVSHRSATKPPWEACWQANIPTPKGRNSPASWAPTDPPRSRCGKLAGKRISQHQRAGIRQQAGLPRIRHEAAVGSLLASEYPNTRGPEFVSKRGSHGSATKPLWEAARAALRLAANALSRWRFACQQASHSGAVAPSEGRSSR